MSDYKINKPNLAPLDLDYEDSPLNLYDPENPDLSLFNLIDDEIIKLSGSRLFIYKYYQTQNFDEVYGEERNKVISSESIVAYGHYEPKALEEPLTEFGIELTNDQLFTFNKAYIERRIGRPLIPGDQIKPAFQNQRYEIFEVQEDSFEAYGVYHLVCSAKLLRDSRDVQPDGEN